MTLPNDCLEAVARAMVRAEWDGLPDAEMEEFVDIEWPAHEKTARAGFLAGLRAVRELDDDLLEYGARAASLVKTTDDPLGAVPVPYDECDSNYRADWRNESEASWKAIMDQLIKEIEQS